MPPFTFCQNSLMVKKESAIAYNIKKEIQHFYYISLKNDAGDRNRTGTGG